MMNIFTRKKKLIEANHKLAVLLKYQVERTREYIVSTSILKVEIFQLHKALEKERKRPYQVVLVDKRLGNKKVKR